ncbi:MAG: hypothetical protein R3Y64_00485 [Peptostreptococcaceae bacterium]
MLRNNLKKMFRAKKSIKNKSTEKYEENYNEVMLDDAVFEELNIENDERKTKKTKEPKKKKKEDHNEKEKKKSPKKTIGFKKKKRPKSKEELRNSDEVEIKEVLEDNNLDRSSIENDKEVSVDENL